MADINSESFSALNFWKSVEKKNISTNFGSKQQVVAPKKKIQPIPLLAPAPPPPPEDLIKDATTKGEWDEQNVTEAFGFWKQKAVQLQVETERYNARRSARQTIDLTNILRKSTSSDLLLKPPTTPTASHLDSITPSDSSSPTSPKESLSPSISSPPVTAEDFGTKITTTTTTTTTHTVNDNNVKVETTITNTTANVILPNSISTSTTNESLQANQLEIKFGGETIAVVDDFDKQTPRDYRRSRSISCEIIPKINSSGGIQSSPQPQVSSISQPQQHQEQPIKDDESDSSEEESSSSDEESDEIESDEESGELEVDVSTPRNDAVGSGDESTPVVSSTSSTTVVQQESLSPDQASNTTLMATTTTTTKVESTSLADNSTTTNTTNITSGSVATQQTPVTVSNQHATAPSSPSSQRASVQATNTAPASITSSNSSSSEKLNRPTGKKDPAKKSIGATLTRTVTKTFIRDSKENNKVPSTGASSASGTPKKEKAKLTKSEKDRIKQEKSAQKKKDKEEKKQQKTNKKQLTKNLSSTDIKKGVPEYSPYRIYGVKLTQLVLSNDGDLPAILTQTITVLSNSNNLDVNAIFSGAENEPAVKEYRRKSDFDRVDFSIINDPRIVAGLLILFFAELPQPLFNSKFFNDLVEVHDITNQQVKLNDIKYLINSLSQLRRSLLQILVTFFTSKYINNNPVVNRAQAISTIAAAFGPQFFRSTDPKLKNQFKSISEETLRLIIDNYVFLFEKTNEPDIKYKNSDGKMIISEGSIDKLIEKATDYYYPYNEKYFSLTFFITHLYFIQPSELVDKLIALYKENHDTETKKKWKKQRSSKKANCISEAVKLWVDYCYKEMREDKELSKKILKGFPHLESQLSSRLNHKSTLDFLRLKRPHNRTRSASFSETFLSAGSKDQLSAVEIAEQCTLVDYDLFTNVRLSDWVRLMQGSVDPSTAPSLSQALKKSTIWTQWAMGEILSTEDKNQRVAIINLLVDVALNCKDLANFNTAISIHNALTNHHIKRLTQTWDAVPKETLNKIQQLEQSLTLWLKPESHNPFAAICQSINSACVPHFSILRTILSQIDQKTPTTIDDGNGNEFINVEKLRSIFSIVVEIQRLQTQRNYTMKPTKLFIQLQDITTVSLDELADLSLKCEPPVSKAKKYNAPETVDEDWRIKISKTFNKTLITSSVGIDLPRLASSFTFKSADGIDNPINHGNKIQDIFNVLLSLAKIQDQDSNIDDATPLLEDSVKEKFSQYIPMSTDPDSDFKRELLKFLDEVCGSDNSKLVRILKCCNQAIIAPVIIEITLNIAKGIPFMDAGGWRILISQYINNNNNNVTLENENDKKDVSKEDSSSESKQQQLFIRHYKKQRSRSAQSKDFFEFEWFIQLNLDQECKNIKSFDLKISSLVFSTDTTPSIRDSLLESFKNYLLSPDCVQYINFNDN
ncbi:hypothetical protein DICPUDRAFT_4417, partial [Dictyostelium purpureum]